MIRQKTIRVTLLPSSELEAIQQEALEFAGIGLYRYRFDGTVLFMDRGAFRIFDLENKFPDAVSVIGRSVSELFVYSGPKELLLKEIRKRSHVRGFEYRFKTLSGVDKVVLNDSYLVKDPKTGQDAIQVIMFDITERKRTEERLRQVLTSARCILWHSTVTQHDNGSVEWLINVSNEDAAEQLLPLDRRPGQKYSEVWHERITPEDRERMDRTSTEAMLGDLPGYSQEFRCTRSDGQIRWLSEETHIQRLGPHQWFVVGVCTDITERKRVEEALRKSEARYRAVVEDQPDLICRFNPDTLLTFVNESYCRYYGKRRDELIGRSFMPLVPLDQRENVKRAYSSLTPSNPFVTYAFPITLPDGRVRWQQWTDRAIFDEQGRFIEYQSSGVDVTEQKEAEHRHRAFSAGLRAVLAIADELISCPDLDSLFKRAVERAREKLGIERCGIFVREGPDLRGTYGTDLKGHTTDERRHHFPTRPDWLERIQALRPQDRRMIVIEQPYVEVRETGAMEHDTGWIAITPIQSATDFLGVFSNDTAITREPMDETKQEIVTVFCSLLGAIIERKRVENKQRKISEGLRAVVAIADELISCPDLDAICRRTVELAREKLDLDRCAIFLRDGNVLRGTYGTSLQRKTTDEHHHEVDPYPDWLKHFQSLQPEDRQMIIHEEPYTEWAGNKVVRFDKGWVALTPIQSAGSFVGMFSNDTAITRTPVDETQQEVVTVLCSLLGAIIERKRVEEESRRLAMAVRQGAEAVVISDTRGQILYVNPAFERMTGYSRNTVIGHNPRFLKSGKQDSQYYARMWETLSHGEVWSGHLSNKRKDGTLYDVEAVISPIRDDKGEIVSYVATTRDVTREMQLEEQFRQAQKMEAIGRLAGGIAHDFNNLLTSILGYSRLVTDELENGNPIKSDMEEIIHAGERAAALTKQLLAFSRKQMIQLQPINLNAVVLDMDKLLRRTLGEDIELVTLIDNEMGCINADAGLIEQAVMNLAVNARDAMPKGGSLTIQTATVRLDEEQCRSRVNVEPGEYVMVSVRDTGMGMSNEVKDHCLEPFFTTKEKGKGTGLGLSIVYSIVKQFGGFIDIETSPKNGTDIRMYLPAVEAAACELVARERVALPRGSETILVVEDEETVRRLAVRILESLGYQVLQARHGGEALLICERFEKPIQLVLSDVVMPHLGGQELIERLRRIRKDFKVLYMSGFTDEAFVRNAKDGQESALLLKPFTQETLAVRVRQILDRRSA
jgi:PAS domain S-box-containing protein